jgi:hypothetical protein
VTVTPNGTWANSLNLGNNVTLKTFDGSTNYISLLDDASWDFWIDAASISFWIKFNSISAGVIFNVYSQYADSSNWASIYWQQSSGLLFFQRYVSGSSNGNHAVSLSPALGNWYHVAFVKSSATGTPSVYINGVLQVLSTSVAQTDSSTVFAAAALIGRNGAGTVFGNGNIKDLLIYKGKALAGAEIGAIMKMSHPTTGKGLVALYPGVRGVE